MPSQKIGTEAQNQTVKISALFPAIKTVCSNCAVLALSAVTAVHPSSRIIISGSPCVRTGSMVNVIPLFIFPGYSLPAKKIVIKFTLLWGPCPYLL